MYVRLDWHDENDTKPKKKRKKIITTKRSLRAYVHDTRGESESLVVKLYISR